MALDPRQDQEARIVDHAMQVLLALAWRPADEAVARLGFPGGGAEAEQGDDAPLGPDEVPQLGAGQWLVAQVVVALEKFVVQVRIVAAGQDLQLERAKFLGRGGLKQRSGLARDDGERAC